MKSENFRMEDEHKIPNPLVALLPIIALTVLLFFSISLFGSDTLSGASQICLLFATGLATLIGMAFYKTRWKAIEDAIVKNIADVGSSLLILLLIGALSGVWMLSGVVPTLIYYGMEIIHPKFFLLCACVICSLVSVVTGSSWTTVATIGIALLGIGKAQGFEDGWIAGAVISGAYFGDKISPLSETTVLASSTAGTPLMKHIRYMLLTTVPSLTIALIVFTIAGLVHTTSEPASMATFGEALQERFCITPWLLVVPVVTGVMIAKQVPPLITLFVSAVLAEIFMIIFQPEVVQEVTGEGLTYANRCLKGGLIALYGSTALTTMNPELSELVQTSGMSGMMGTVWLIICAMCLGGAMTACNMLLSITKMFARLAKNLVSMVASTVGCGLFMNLALSDQYMSILLTINMFKGTFLGKGYENRLLSRTTEDAVTVTSVLIPWNTCGLTQATVLGVPTLTYLPYCVFNYVSPLMSILVAATGYKIFRKVKSEE